MGLLVGGCGDNSDFTPQSTSLTPAPPIGTGISQSVQEGCAAATRLRGMIQGLDADLISSRGTLLLLAMVSTDDAILNMNGELIADAMEDDGSQSDEAYIQHILDGFNAYVTTCGKLGAH